MKGERSPEHLWAPRLLLRVTALGIRTPALFAVIAAVLLVVSGPWAARLYMELRTDLRELLPRGAPAARALDALEHRLGGIGHLSIVVETEDPTSGKRFVDALGARLVALGPTFVHDVQYRTDDARKFFDAHGALYADTADLEDLDAGLRAEVDRAKRNANPLYFDLEEDESEVRDPRLERAAARLRAQADKANRFPSGYLSDDQEHTFVLLVTPTDAAVSLHSNTRLLRAVEGVVRDLRPATFHPSMHVGYGGEVRDIIEAQAHLVKDLLLSTVLVVSVVSAAIVAFYRSLRAIFVLAAPLLAGASVAYATSRFAIGYLNPNTAFLGAVIIGNGINPGILLLARFFEERRRGRTTNEALMVAVKGTWLGTFTACAAAAAGYASLSFAGFRGFNQFAFMGCVGMLAVWMSTYAFLPPLVVLAERRRPLCSTVVSSEKQPSERFAAGLGRRAPLVALASALFALLSAALVVRFAHDPLEYDFTRLGSRQGKIDGSIYWGRRADSVLKAYVVPTVILTASQERAMAVAKALRAAKAAQGPEGAIDRVVAFDDVVPPDQARRIELLERIFGQLTPRVLESLPANDRMLIEKLERTTVLAPVTLSDVPTSLGRFFREKDGQVGRLVLVYPTLGANAQHGRIQIEFARSIRAAARSADPGAQVAGGTILMADVIESITRDGSIATVLSFAGVALLAVLLTRALRDAVWIVGALFLGTLWMGGVFGALGIKLNFANFVVLPITFGIGVDYAVNLYQRYKEVGPGRIAAALSGSGGAVALCSLTTIIGYAALLVADYQAVFSFGLTAVVGEIACLTSALVAMPALIAVRDRRLRLGASLKQALALGHENGDAGGDAGQELGEVVDEHERERTRLIRSEKDQRRRAARLERPDGAE